jgi:hypothetical protein
VTAALAPTEGDFRRAHRHFLRVESRGAEGGSRTTRCGRTGGLRVVGAWSKDDLLSEPRRPGCHPLPVGQLRGPPRILGSLRSIAPRLARSPLREERAMQQSSIQYPRAAAEQATPTTATHGTPASAPSRATASRAIARAVAARRSPATRRSASSSTSARRARTPPTCGSTRPTSGATADAPSRAA